MALEIKFLSKDPDTIACLPVNYAELKEMNLGFLIITTPYLVEGIAYAFNDKEMNEAIEVRLEPTFNKPEFERFEDDTKLRVNSVYGKIY